MSGRTPHRYWAMREFVRSMDDTLPGKFEITKEGIVHDLMAPNPPHELTRARISRRLERVMPEEFLAHSGEPDVEDETEGIMRLPDVIVTAVAEMEGEGSFDPRTLTAAIEIVSRSNPENDWVSKMRDYPLLGIPVYVIFDPRTSTGAVLSEIHPTAQGPRYATRKDFVYGEDATIGEWTISTEGLPRYGGGPGSGGTPPRTFRSAGAGGSGRIDLSESMEELLAEPAESHAVLPDDEVHGGP